MHEICTETNFNDKQRVLRILKQTKIFMEQGFINNGHAYAKGRARSYFSPSALLAEQTNGIDFYLWLCELLEHFDERFENLHKKLSELTKTLFCDDACTLSFAGSSEAQEIFWKTNESFTSKSAGEKLQTPTCVQKNEAFIVKSNVCFASVASDRHLFEHDAADNASAATGNTDNVAASSAANNASAAATDSSNNATNKNTAVSKDDFSGAWLVANTALSLDYLWNEIRVKGGAYGVGFAAKRLGDMSYYTYRDPHLNSSIKRIANSATWLSSFKTDAQGFDGFIISAVSSIDAPVKARALIARQDSQYFRGEDESARAKLRKELLECNIEQVYALSPYIQRAIDTNNICVIGNEKILKNNKLGLKVIELC